MPASSGRSGILGVLPELGGSIGLLARAGQSSRLTDYYLKTYARSFEHVYYFSYADERLEDYTSDPEVLSRVTLVPNSHGHNRLMYAWRMPLEHRSIFRRLDVLRVLQLTGVPPAAIARRLWRTPVAATYGFRYAQLAAMTGDRRRACALAWAEPRLLRRCDRAIVTTAELADYVRPWALPALIPNGVDLSVFAPRAPRANGGPIRLLFVGRLEAEKNLPRLLAAVRAVASKGICLTLDIVGEGSMRESLQQTAAETADVMVRFHGRLPQPEVAPLMQSSDVFVFPSLSEGHPKALIEAMACALPCVTGNRGGMASLVEHEKTGLLCNPEDTDDIAAQIARVATDSAFANTLGLAAHNVAMHEYDLGALLQREADLLRELAHCDKNGTPA